MDESRQLADDPWLFEGPPRTLPTAGNDPGAVDGPWSGSVFQPVRHYPGYGDFVGCAAVRGEDPALLASDIASLLRFLIAHAAALAAEENLRLAAEIFVGNTLVQMRADARWFATVPGEMVVGTQSNLLAPGMLMELCSEADPERVAEALARALERLKAWAAEEPDDPRPLDPIPRPREAVATWYKTPARGPEGFRDPSGNGHRWGEMGAPTESYGRVSHPERFAPLEDVLDALVGHLETSYLVKRVDAVHPGGRSIALHPDDPLAAPLRLELNKHQGQTSIRVFAGLLHDFVYPSCGCDACDESAENVGEELEETVLGVVAGGFAERIHGTGSSSLAEYCLNTLDGDSSGSDGRPVGTGPDMDPGGAAALLALIPNGWHPWPLKVESTGVH